MFHSRLVFVVLQLNDITIYVLTEGELSRRESFALCVQEDDIAQRRHFRLQTFEGQCIGIRVFGILCRYKYLYGVFEYLDIIYLCLLFLDDGNDRYRSLHLYLELVVTTLRVEVSQRLTAYVDHVQRSVRREFYRVVNRVQIHLTGSSSDGNKRLVTQSLIA